MKNIILIIFLILIVSACGVDVEVDTKSSEHTIKVVNPIIEFCERLHPEFRYSSYEEREIEIIDCLETCTISDACTINIP